MDKATLILDATAGNRVIWYGYKSPNIIYIDKQKQLERPPTIFADNRCTPFNDETFDTIFFDPPYGCGSKTDIYAFPNKKLCDEYGKWGRKTGHSYYGMEQFHSRSQLIKYLYEAIAELHRILKSDGLLWLKWNEVMIPLSHILPLFGHFKQLLKLYIKNPITRRSSAYQTYWICFEKNMANSHEYILDDFNNG